MISKTLKVLTGEKHHALSKSILASFKLLYLILSVTMLPPFCGQAQHLGDSLAYDSYSLNCEVSCRENNVWIECECEADTCLTIRAAYKDSVCYGILIYYSESQFEVAKIKIKEQKKLNEIKKNINIEVLLDKRIIIWKRKETD